MGGGVEDRGDKGVYSLSNIVCDVTCSPSQSPCDKIYSDRKITQGCVMGFVICDVLYGMICDVIWYV